jgi:glycosyltransferase involved in cell wall biosynthesis
VRVLHVSGGQVYGGIERMLATLAATPSGAVTQQFAVPPAGRLWRELQDLGAGPLALPWARASRPLSVVSARRGFARLLSAVKPDAAVFHGSWSHAIFASVARAHGALVAFWQHTPIMNPHWPDRWASWTAPDVLIANSRFTATALAFPRAAAHVIYCAVPSPSAITAESRRAGRAALGATDADLVVFLAARLEMTKGHQVLVDAARLLDRRDVTIWIAGGVQREEERPYLDQLTASAAGLRTRIALLGEREDVPALMQLADLYCQPNLVPEPFGIAIAEAMRAGLPCVVSNAGGAAELVDETCGIVTEPGDTAGVAAAIGRLAADPAARAAMGRAAASRAALLTDPAGRLADMAAALTLQPTHAR